MHEWLQFYAVHGVKIVYALLREQRPPSPIDAAKTYDDHKGAIETDLQSERTEKFLQIKHDSSVEGISPSKMRVNASVRALVHGDVGDRIAQNAAKHGQWQECKGQTNCQRVHLEQRLRRDSSGARKKTKETK